MGDCRAHEMRAQACADQPTAAGEPRPAGEPIAWLARLRARLERGELDGLRRLRLDNGTTLVNVGLAARRLLAELAELDALPPARRDRGYARTRRRRSLDTLERLERA
jgi:hypothetical protein